MIVEPIGHIEATNSMEVEAPRKRRKKPRRRPKGRRQLWLWVVREEKPAPNPIRMPKKFQKY